MANNKKPNDRAKKSTSVKKVNYPYKESKNSEKKNTKNNVNNKTTKQVRNKKKKKNNFIGRILKWFFFTVFFIGLTVFVIGLGYIFAIIKSTPPIDVEAVKTLSEPTSLYDRNGDFMDNLNSEVNRNIISYEEIPQDLKNAYVAIEDQRFYQHNGIDIRRIGGSILTDIQKIFRGERGFHGGSTITQQ